MSDGQAGESSGQPAGSSTNSSRPVGTLRDATSAQPTSRVIGNVLNRKPTDGAAGSSRGRRMFLPNAVIRRKADE